MLQTILTPPSHMRLDHIPPIQERHLAIGLDPHLVPRVGGNHVQGRDVQPELARLGELAQAGAEGEEVGPRHGGGKVGERERHVVDARGVQAEDVSGGGGGGVRGGRVGGSRWGDEVG